MEFRKILRSAINEIYARHGYIFGKNTENEKYYQKFQWYKDTQKHSVCWDEFNDTEKKNLRLLQHHDHKLMKELFGVEWDWTADVY